MGPQAAVRLLVGTRKGAFIAESDVDRREWRLHGPCLPGHQIMHMAFEPRSGILFSAGGEPWFGSRVYQSWDFGRTWDAPASGPIIPAGSNEKLEKVWHVTPGRALDPGVVHAGVEPAAMFKSGDDSATWLHIESLSHHPTRSQWQPGAGGLCLHTIVLDPLERDRALVAISAAGVFRTDDGDTSWRHANNGTRANFMPDQEPVYPEFGQCVHKVVPHPARPGRLYQQDHCGVYRSDNWGDSWTEITAGMPSDCGFPIAVHPHDPDTLYVCPGNSGYHHWVPDGQLAVYRSRNAGETWERLSKGLPQTDAFHSGRHGDRPARNPGPVSRYEHRPALHLGRRGRQLGTLPSDVPTDPQRGHDRIGGRPSGRAARP
ncbi:MAG: exo-alpha-sialidase [Actinobacteria bacterium]|nr:exo-alpha-sialidase [Actinomycetota bacterium]